MIIKLGKHTVKETAISGIPAIKSSKVPLFVTLQRPPPVPASFLPSFLFFFDQQRRLAIRGAGNGRHHTCWATTDDNGVKMSHVVLPSLVFS